MALRALRPAATGAVPPPAPRVASWQASERDRGDPMTAAPAWSGEVVRPTGRLEERPRGRFAALLGLVALSGLGIGAAVGFVMLPWQGAVLPRHVPDGPTTTVAAEGPEPAVAPAPAVETPRADRPVPPAASASSLRAALAAIRKRIDAAQAGMPASIGGEPALEVSRVAARVEPDAAAPTRPEPAGTATAPPLLATRELVRLRAAPGDGGEVLAVLEPHVIVEEIGRRGGWVQVRYIDRFRSAHAGWIADPFLRHIAGGSSPAAGKRR
jgi:hypothetical protein